MQTLESPTNEQIRDEAVNNVPISFFNKKGRKSEGIRMITEEFLRLQFKYFPLFCEEARQVNIMHLKELKDTGYRTSTKMVGGTVYDGTDGWSKDKKFKHKWIVPQQLRTFMTHIYKKFWDDSNSNIRDKFMKELLKGGKTVKGSAGGSYYESLREVYKHYGQNIIIPFTKEDYKQVGFPA